MKKTENKQRNVYDYHDTFDMYGIAVVGKDGKFGYVRQNGEEVTPPKYDKAMRFDWRVGKVCINGKWGLVDMSGKEITPLIYDEIKGNQDPIVKLYGKYGYLNRATGELLTPVKYDHACAWTQEFGIGFDDSHDFHDHDLAGVQLDGKWGCIDIRGKEIIPLKYDKIKIYQLENPCVAANINGKWGFIDSRGREVTLFEYERVECFCEHRARVEKNGKFGFIDDKGALVIPAIYDDCESHFRKSDENGHIYPVAMRLNGKYGYIDANGNEMVKPMYEDATSFHCNKLAAVVLNGKVGFIDETGKEIIPFIYELFDNLHEQFVPVEYRFLDNFANVKLNGKWGVIDSNNKVVIPFLYDEFLQNYHAGWRYAMRDGKKWSIDTKGNERVMQKNPNARTFKDYLRAVTSAEVVESGRSLLTLSKKEAKLLKVNYDNFSAKTPRPSQNIIRIFADYGLRDWRHPPIDAALYCVENECSYGYFDWEEILDMEVRVEDDLTLSDAEIAAVCIWEACDQILTTEENIRKYLDRLHEQVKTSNENENI